jgi:nicotinamide riboside transporter PnuC
MSAKRCVALELSRMREITSHLEALVHSPTAGVISVQISSDTSTWCWAFVHMMDAVHGTVSKQMLAYTEF